MTDRTTVRLPTELIIRAKRKAASEGRSLTSLIEDGLRRVVSERSPSPPEDRTPLPVSSAQGGLAPGFSWDDLKRLDELEDFESLRRSS
jgi:hypothetical protein